MSQEPAKWRRRLLLAGLFGLLALWAGTVWFVSSASLHPPWHHPAESPEQGLWTDWEEVPPYWMGIYTDPRSDFGLDYQDVEFAAEDGTTLRGWFVPAGDERKRIVVAVHGGGSDRRDWLRHVPVFHEAGLPVLLFDCREHGTSDGGGRGVTFGAREQRDVSSAVRWAKQTRGFERVAVIGTSQGGASVLLAGARDDQIDLVIAENPYTDIKALLTDQDRPIPGPILWPLRSLLRWRTFGSAPQPIDVVDRIAPRPLLLIHGSADTMVPSHHSERLFDRAREPKALWIAEGAGHTESFNRHPDEYRRRVQGFLASHFR